MEKAMLVLNLYVEGVYGQSEAIRKLDELGFKTPEDIHDLKTEAEGYFPSVQFNRIKRYILECM